MPEFGSTIAAAYGFTGPTLELGRGVHEGAVAPEADVKVPLAMLNRHGLIAGATGTGKTKTLQVFAEGLSAAGVPVLVADVKGDVSGISQPGDSGGGAEKRMTELGLKFEASGFPVEFLSLGGIGPGVPMRATVSDFGPQLLAKILQANEVQEQSLTLVFHYADEKGLGLVDLSDLRALLTYLSSKDGKAELDGIGGLSAATVGVLLRALVGLETGGGNEFFGETSFDVNELLRTAPDGRGVITCVELPAVQEHPALWSTALLGVVAELFETLPEAGDLPKPKFCVFLDEAHLLFDEATDAFLDSIERTVRLIRSKGVGVYFVTQSPTDVPESVLAQLANRVQHALRAFTPKDAKALKQTVSTFPTSDFYDLEELLPALGIGEAIVTILDEHGVPTPVVHTRMVAPRSKMGPADNVDAAAKASPLFAKYAERVDPISAKELIAQRLDAAEAAGAKAAADAQAAKDKAAADAAAAKEAAARQKEADKQAAAEAREEAKLEKEAEARARAQERADEAAARRAPRRQPQADGPMGELNDFLKSSTGRKLKKEVVRGVFGMLKKKF